jgi:nitrile hydratase accessory protein
LTDPPKAIALDAQGPAAPPRENGELVFETPWESRLFGLTMALHGSGRFEWEEFRQRLIEEIASWESAASERPRARFRYYERWQAALERLLSDKGLCARADLDRRSGELAARPPNHDHDH